MPEQIKVKAEELHTLLCEAKMSHEIAIWNNCGFPILSLTRPYNPHQPGIPIRYFNIKIRKKKENLNG